MPTSATLEQFHRDLEQQTVTLDQIHRDIEQQTKRLKAIAQELKRAKELKVKELVDAGILTPELPQLQTETRSDMSE